MNSVHANRFQPRAGYSGRSSGPKNRLLFYIQLGPAKIFWLSLQRSLDRSSGSQSVPDHFMVIKYCLWWHYLIFQFTLVLFQRTVPVTPKSLFRILKKKVDTKSLAKSLIVSIVIIVSLKLRIFPLIFNFGALTLPLYEYNRRK